MKKAVWDLQENILFKILTINTEEVLCCSLSECLPCKLRCNADVQVSKSHPTRGQSRMSWPPGGHHPQVRHKTHSCQIRFPSPSDSRHPNSPMNNTARILKTWIQSLILLNAVIHSKSMWHKMCLPHSVHHLWVWPSHWIFPLLFRRAANAKSNQSII